MRRAGAILLDLVHHGFGSYAGNRLFASGINVENKNVIRLLESRAELLEESLRPRVTVRLKNDMDLSVTTLACCRQRRLDLGGLMAVIVDNGYAVHRSAQLKTPVNATEMLQGRAHLLHIDFQTNSDCNSSRCVQHVVNTGHMQMKVPQRLAAVLDSESAARTTIVRCRVDIDDPEI